MFTTYAYYNSDKFVFYGEDLIKRCMAYRSVLDAGVAAAAGSETPGNLWVQPLDGAPAWQLTHFTDDRPIRDIAWSRDGQRLAIARTTTTNDIVLFKGLKR